ncbi:hypothetical protein [Methanospirillum lacunae]|uniref:Uncharacterized protein n=1 Tax=Methanospirillum lacunae TaxID=668570 RepID=A0A2V2N3S3_9EURY|nr:hypothetical protein [Methanospirillum lacunae]PWR70121.1 hypothetical protein DK846_15365 [Methanospirillum lacunae]
MKKLYLALLIVLLTGFCSAFSSASTITISPASISGIGMSSTATISLDSADQGLSGYVFSVYPQSPQIASITGAIFPAWATLSDASHGEGAAYTIRALDMNDAVVPGATNVLLATLNLNGVSPGSTQIVIEVKQLDDDAGNAIIPQTIPGQITVGGSSGDQILNLQLTPGWNFVGIPMVMQPGTDTAEVFRNVPSAGHSVFTYDAQKGWSIVGPKDALSPMNAYWIFTEQALTIPLRVQGPATSPRSLGSGWNIFGPPGMAQKPASDILACLSDWTYVVGFDSAHQQYQQSIIKGGSGQNSDKTPLVPGAGYWIYLSAPGQLTP